MEDLNSLESAILQAIINENVEKYPFLAEHLPYLKVKSREYTGVGMYSNFIYSKPINITEIKNCHLSSKKRLVMKSFKHEFSYEINITDGKIHFLEIVTNEDKKWDGNFENFALVD